jgi:hypothetical protein
VTVLYRGRDFFTTTAESIGKPCGFCGASFALTPPRRIENVVEAPAVVMMVVVGIIALAAGYRRWTVH